MQELLFGGIRMDIPDAQFRVSTDSMVLADFCRPRKNSRVLDLGCGCGTLGLLLLGEDPTLHLSGVELQPLAAQAAQKNAEANGLADRFTVVCGDLRQPNAKIAAGTYDCVISNPPYYPPQSGFLPEDSGLCLARSEQCCAFSELCTAAARALHWGGRFFLVHKPERLVDLLTELRRVRLEAKRIRFVRHKAADPVNLVLIEARLGGRPGLQYEPDLVLYAQTGEPSEAYRRIYHLQE